MSESSRQLEFLPEVLFQPLGGEAVLLNLNNNRYYGLNEVGARTWQLLQEHGEVDAAVTQLLEEYEVDEATLRQDVEALVAQLIEQEMLTAVSTPAS